MGYKIERLKTTLTLTRLVTEINVCVFCVCFLFLFCLFVCLFFVCYCYCCLFVCFCWGCVLLLFWGEGGVKDFVCFDKMGCGGEG